MTTLWAETPCTPIPILIDRYFDSRTGWSDSDNTRRLFAPHPVLPLVENYERLELAADAESLVSGEPLSGGVTLGYVDVLPVQIGERVRIRVQVQIDERTADTFPKVRTLFDELARDLRSNGLEDERRERVDAPAGTVSELSLTEADVKVDEAWQDFSKQRGGQPGRYPSPLELADKAGVSSSQAKKSLRLLRSIGRIPHSKRSGRALP